MDHFYLQNRLQWMPECCPDEGAFFISASQRLTLNKAVDIDTVYEQVIKNIFEGDSNTPHQDRALIAELYSQLREAIKEGVGKIATKFEYGTPNQVMAKNLQTNVAAFSAFKKHDMMKELVKELKDDSGKLKSFAEFKKTALPLVGDYRQSFLQNEYDAAVRGSRMATQWQKFQKDKDIQPNIKYVLSRSAKRREDHAALAGTILPIDDPFWDVHCPPNGWGCKCSISNTSETPTEIKGSITVDPMFAFNPGKEGQVFDLKKHPYTQLPQKEYQNALHEAKGALYKFEKTELQKQWKQDIQGKLKVEVDNLSKPVTFTANSFKKNMELDDHFMDRLNLLSNIEDVLKNSTYVNAEPPKKVKEHVKQYHVLKYNKKDKQVAIYLQEAKDGNVVLYSMHIKKAAE